MTFGFEGGSSLDTIADAIHAKKCILFLGAGVHAPPPEGSHYNYPAADRPLLGSELSVALADLCGLAERYPQEDPRNLARVAMFYENEFSRRQLVEAVAQRIHKGRKPSPILRALAELDFPVVITTNYETLYEFTLAEMGKQPRVAIYTPDREITVDYPDPTPASPVLRKLHGDILHPQTLVLTDEDYMDFTMRMTDKELYDPVPLRLKAQLMDWTTLFVGYRLQDYNLRLLIATLRWKIDRASMPSMYAVDVNPDPLILEVWDNRRRYVKFIAKDIWAFVPSLYERVLGREPQLS